jgi:hypothetical protein
MTGSDDSYSNTRPISVAELLARNGTIGAPPVGGRRRRRRGNADSVTVAELTGEIPIIRPTDPDTTAATAAGEEEVEEVPTAEPDAEVTPEIDSGEALSTNGAVDRVAAEREAPEREAPEPEVAEPEVDVDVAEPEVDEPEVAEPEVDDDREVDAGDVDDDYADAVAEYAAHLEQRDADPDPVDFLAPPPKRFGFGRQSSKDSVAVDAEQMSPDPLDDDGGETDLLDSPVDLVEPPEIEDLDNEAALDAENKDELPTYLRSTRGPLFGGQTVADDLARRRGSLPAPDDIDLGDADELDGDDEDDEDDEPRRMSSFVHGLWIVGQSIIAVVLGAGLFVAFDQLWKWNNIVALVLSVLVILGLVVGVRVVRKTEDIGSTLIAVAVGALITLGPLALLQSG